MSKTERSIQDLELFLKTDGAMDARTLALRLGVSQPTLSRLVSRAGHQLERIGKGRSTKYALRRDVRQYGSEWPLYRVSEQGKVVLWATLRALHGDFRIIPHDTPPFWMSRPEYRDGLSRGLPFFLQDVRPQGFLGRAIARRLQLDNRFPSDVSLWSDDDVLTYFIGEGEDLPGDFVVGDNALSKVQRLWDSAHQNAVETTQREERYPELAQAVLNAQSIGSSAGGEQPKFLATLKETSGALSPVLVKFSPPLDSPAGQRWADLLACELLVSETLRSSGESACECRIVDAGNRRFLEIHRFDRTPQLGRRGLITVGAIENALVERNSRDWAEAAQLLHEDGLIAETEARRLRWLWCFGELIANSDMHPANASVFFTDQGPWQLTPTYDMLPMLFRPTAQGEITPDVAFTPRLPRASVHDVWPSAAKVALEFWQRVAADSRITPAFRETASACENAVAKVLARVAS